MRVESTQFQVEHIRPGDLADADAGLWLAFQAAQPAFESPLLGPEFARAVGSARDDAKVAIFRRNDGEAAGFLAYHRRPGGFGRPIGSPFADYHALIGGPDFGITGIEAVERAGLRAFRHNGLVDPYGLFPAYGEQTRTYAIELHETPEAYLETVRAASPKKFKNYRRLQNRMAETGPLRIGPDRSQAAFDQVMTWKSEQFGRTGVQDVLRPDWVRQTMQSLFETHDGRLTGLLLTLYCGEVLVAGHFGVMAAGVFHPWIASTSPEFAAMSPGQVFLDQAIKAMPALGIRVYDLGPGHDHYKKPFASTCREVGVGLTIVPGAAGTLPRARERAWSMGGLDRVGTLGRIRRRLDHIAAVDPSTAGRARGLLEAGRSMRKRLATDARAE